MVAWVGQTGLLEAHCTKKAAMHSLLSWTIYILLTFIGEVW